MDSADLVDGVKTALKCSNCKTPLVVVWQVSKNTTPKPTYWKAKCWKCGDHSFIVKGDGKVVCLHTDISVMVDADESEYKDGVLTTISTVRNPGLK